MFARALFTALCCVAALAFTAIPAEAASPIKFTTIRYDSPGKDTRSNASLKAEYVTIKNTGSKARTLTGWTLRDASGHVYKFGTFKLGAGKSVKIRTGSGTNTSRNRYWGADNYVWNNTKDKATLRTAKGTKIDTCSWTTKDHGTKTC
jgi:hypothetical protein